MKRHHIKFLIVTMGPGETSQGVGLAGYAVKRGDEVILAARRDINYSFFQTHGGELKFFLTDTSEKLKNLYEREKPDVFVLCNSKVLRYYQDFLKTRPLPQAIAVSLDSNWLFIKGEEWYSFAEWVDKYLIIFPQKIFDAGLKKHGGNYEVPEQIMKKIKAVGFIPSYKKPSKKLINDIRKKYDIKKDEKFIFSYFSGFGASHRIFAFYNLISAVDRLIKKGRKIKVLYVGPTESLDPEKVKMSWVMTENKLLTDKYFLTLASSDLVFQHQGLATLSQAVSARVPIIANVQDLKDEKYSRHAHAWEVGPFAKLGLCKMFYRSTPVEKISQEIERLLYNKSVIKKMTEAQKKYYISGESSAYQAIQKLFKNKK